MRIRSVARHLPVVVAVLLALLLVVMAVLQWRWTGEVSAMERQRMRSRLLAAGSRFSHDFDREVARAFSYFLADPTAPEEKQLEQVHRQYERWNAEAPYPRLIRDVFLIRPSVNGEAKLEILRPAQRRFEACAWPAELAAVRRRWSGTPPPRLHPGRDLLVGETPALVFPLSFLRHWRGRLSGDRSDEIHLLVRLDRETISGQILPALTRQYFDAAGEAEYAVAVMDAEDPGEMFFRSAPEVPLASFRSPDLTLGLFTLRRFEELRARDAHRGARAVLWRAAEPLGPPAGEGVPLTPGGGPHGAGMGGGPPLVKRWRGEVFEEARPPDGPRREPAGAWRLLVKRRDGSLEQAVAAVRRRNLGISLGILALLAATVGLMMVATERAQHLARQQIEFVAGVTHELHTPLTAIRSAGQNLADGVVAEPAQVRRYGTLIANESRRLSDMMGQALEFAGIQSGRRGYHLRPVEVAEIVDGALLDSHWLLQERRVEVAREVAPDLPFVMADAAALRQAVQNLVQNAVKYGGRANWIGVRARRSAPGEVEITVADRGAGIRKEDLPHLFEPFFRGRDAAAGGVPGSGLGLSLVRHIAEAHGGRVTVETGEGSAFTLHVPAAAEAPEMQAVGEPA